MIVSKKRITDIRKRTKNTGSMQAIKRVGLDPATERERRSVWSGFSQKKKKWKKPLELESLLLLLFGLGLFVCFSFFFFGCFSGFLQIKVNLIRSKLPFFSFYSDLISLFWLKSKSAAWSSSTVAAKVDQSLLRLSLKSTPMMTTPCSLAKSNQNLRIQTPFTRKHKYKTMKLQSKQKKKKKKKIVRRETTSLLTR